MIEGVNTDDIDTTVDLGWARDSHAKPCAKRYGGCWCIQDDGHEGPCVTPAPREIPVTDFGPGRGPYGWGKR